MDNTPRDARRTAKRDEKSTADSNVPRKIHSGQQRATKNPQRPGRGNSRQFKARRQYVRLIDWQTGSVPIRIKATWRCLCIKYSVQWRRSERSRKVSPPAAFTPRRGPWRDKRGAWRHKRSQRAPSRRVCSAAVRRRPPGQRAPKTATLDVKFHGPEEACKVPSQGHAGQTGKAK